MKHFYFFFSVIAEEYEHHREVWIERTQQLLRCLPPSHYRLLGYLAHHLSSYEARHGRSSGVCGVFAPVVLPHVPPATTLLRDIITEASKLFPDWLVNYSTNYIYCLVSVSPLHLLCLFSFEFLHRNCK